MNAIILAIGEELVSGQTVDTNSAYLSLRLGALGIRTVAHRTVGDDRTAIAEAFRVAAAEADVVLATGGLGPTADDLSRHGLADAMGAELVTDPASLEAIEAFFRRRGRQMTATNRVQAMVPVGAEPIENPMGTAPGIAARLGDAKVFVMPGVPVEMEVMFDRSVAGRLGRRNGVILHRVLHTFGAGESDLAGRIGDLMARDANPLVGTTASAGMVSIRITARGDDGQSAGRLADEVGDELRRRLGHLVIGAGDESMASAVGGLLVAAGQSLATAESCTGGLIGQMLTASSGASDYYRGGVVAYANAVKCDVLGVGEDLLAEHGAVSEPVAAAMAEGCRDRCEADWALSVTGIAGPTGATESKPVGLVYIGVAGPDGTVVHGHHLPGSRELIRHRAAMAALNHIRLALLDRD